MAELRKYYVVWEGRDTGVFDSWDEVYDLVLGYPNARYQAFDNIRDAVAAYRGSAAEHLAFAKALGHRMASAQQAPQQEASQQSPENHSAGHSSPQSYRMDALAVDGACAGNPGPMEYRCVRVSDGAEIFRVGPLAGGTNNIAEYIAIIHAASLLAKRGLTDVPIYTDSATALSWIKKGHSNSKLKPSAENAQVIELLARADAWKAANAIRNPIIKWDTESWGEIPADFGRKSH